MDKYQRQQSKSVKSLPPLFQQLSSFQFGKLIIQLNIEQLKDLNVAKVGFQFMGGNSAFYDNKKIIQFPIKTTLWHFYQYLKDMQSINIIFMTSNNQQLLCQRKIQLLPAQKVINSNFLKGNYIANSVQLSDVYDSKKQNKGYTMIKIKLQFEEFIHRDILQIIDLSGLMNNPEENHKMQIDSNPNKSSKNISLNAKNEDYMPKKNNFDNAEQKSNKQNQLNTQNIHQNYIQHNIKQQNSYSEVNRPNYEEIQHSRIVEDEIDRMIAQMQNKPYDSSRYIQNPSNNSFLPTTNFQKPNFNNSRTNFHLTGSSISHIQNYGEMNKHSNYNLNNSRSKSPLGIKKYPHVPLPNKMQQEMPLGHNTTIYSERSLSPGLNSRKKSLNRTQQLPHQSSLKNLNSFSGSRVSNTNGSNKGCLKLQIHELLGRQLQNDEGLILNIYINNQYEQILTCKGYLQGQIILFNQKTEINQCVLSEIQKIRFQLVNWQGQVIYSSQFEMSRLLNIPKLEGIFMLNFHPHSQQFFGNSIVASQTILKKMQKPPTQRTLRISVSFTQQLQVIQMYLNLSKFSLNFNKCKYKIPFTKQTVEFEPTQTHFNIFPHNKNYTKFIIQFWNDKTIIGGSEINLANIKNISKNILQCNVQPICLYDCMFPIKNLFNQNQIGKYKLLVYCGNVRQIQHILNKSMLNRTQSLNQSQLSHSNKVPIQVQYDKKLGVFIKDRKCKQQIQIQVDQKELQQQKLVTKKYPLKVNLNQNQNQQKQEIQHQISMVSDNQFLKGNQVSSSKLISMNLNQQQIQDEDEEQQVSNIRNNKKITQNKNQALNSKITDNISTKKIVTQPQKEKQVQKSIKNIQKKQQIVQKPLKNLSKIICQKIQQSFVPLSSNKFYNFLQLKSLCKSKLLFNFIDIDVLIKHMIELGISKVSINHILQILQPNNGMINFNILNDFMISLQLEGHIKQNILSDKLFVKYVLKQYYQLYCEKVQDRQREEGIQKKVSRQIKWLDNKYLSQIAALDESIDFNQMKKLFVQLNIKISMNEYNILKKFLQNEKEIKEYLYQLSQTKQIFQQMIKSQNNIYQTLKLSIIQEIVKNKTQQNLTKKYQQNILNKLYDSKISVQSKSNYQSQVQEQVRSQMNQSTLINERLNQFNRANQKKISKQDDMETNILQNISFAKNQPIKKYQTNQTSKNTKINPSIYSRNKEYQTQYEQQNHQSFKSTNKYFQEDQDDFIINGLNSNSNKPKQTKNKPIEQYRKVQDIKSNIGYQKQQKQDEFAQTFINFKKYKEKTPQVQMKNGTTTLNYTLKRKITVEGLQSCMSTYECQLDKQLRSPFFKVCIQKPYQKKLYFKQSDKSTTQQFQIKVSETSQEDQEIEGQIILNQITQKGEIMVAAIRFVVIKGIKSVYAMKTLEDESFCGLINIFIE